ncbi:PAS domain S-box protein [Marivirga sp. S37H4]|uniref:histidine kinase n=1 Tax=Marivirga aurantiaca TaxID=2802615 RepID=A0A935C6M7_9BACT|nr:histidine kinase [Marivirga aurantiaca]MBK6264460.1 PAS domain S-box protein [Marivirga aurantiaca]
MKDHESMYKEIIEAMEEGVIVYNAEGKIEVVNTNVEKVFGYKKEELIGQPIKILIPGIKLIDDNDTTSSSANFGDISGKKAITQVQMFSKKGIQLDSRVKFTPINNNRTVIFLSGINEIDQYFEKKMREISLAHIDDHITQEDRRTGTIHGYEVATSNQKNSTKPITDALLTGIEEERKRIAGELHDGLVQTLSAVSLNLKSLQESVDDLHETEQKSFDEALGLLSLAINETQAISHDLMPPAIERVGLSKSLKHLAENINRNSTTSVIADIQQVDEMLSGFHMLNIYRIVQELVQNSIKHANAGSLHISLKKEADSIKVKVEDDGNGFHFQETQQAGIGLRNIQLRVKSMDGKIVVNSTKLGTKIKILIPIVL